MHKFCSLLRVSLIFIYTVTGALICLWDDLCADNLWLCVYPFCADLWLAILNTYIGFYFSTSIIVHYVHFKVQHFWLQSYVNWALATAHTASCIEFIGSLFLLLALEHICCNDDIYTGDPLKFAFVKENLSNHKDTNSPALMLVPNYNNKIPEA